MRRSAFGIGLILLSACTEMTELTEADRNVEFISAAITSERFGFTEVSVQIGNATRTISAERYAACIAAARAQERGDIWLERLRGARRVRGAEEDLVVLYRVERVDELTGEGVFTAALTTRICELDGIPTEIRSRGAPDELPPLTLSGPEAPTVAPDLPEVDIGDLEVEDTPPDPPSPPPTDPEFGI